jgi:hypothetical protein
MPITIDEELDAELDRILGDRLLFDLTEPQRYGGPSGRRSSARSYRDGKEVALPPHSPGRLPDAG